MSVQARRVENFQACTNPGDFFITPPNPHEGGARRLSFLCPCGCGDLAGIRVRDDGSQKDGAWAWDKNEDCPTCTPSIGIMCRLNKVHRFHWHGYLTKGVFEEAK